MNKYTEEQVRKSADSVKNSDCHGISAILNAYADLLAAKGKAKCMLTDAELADPEYVRAYIEEQNQTIADLLAAQPVAVPDGWRAKIAEIAAACSDHETTDALDAMLAAPSPAAEGAKVAQPAEVLSDEQILDMADGCTAQYHDLLEFARAIERAVLAQPSGGDERAAFENDARRHIDPARAAELLARSESGDYEEWGAMLAWEAWQARAALAPQQVQNAEPVAYLHYAKKKPSDRLLSFKPQPTIQQRARGWVSLPLCAAIAAARGNDE